MDSQFTRSRQRILESAVALLRERGLSGNPVEAAAKNVPAWVTVVAWTSLAAVVVLFLSSAASR